MEYLAHHGILGQQWGKRNGPPYPLSGGDYSKREIKAIVRKRKSHNNIYNKKHFDQVLSKENTTLSTLSYDPNRTKDTDMFFATYKKLDKHQYNALFNQPIDKVLYDENGKEIGTGRCLKYRIDNDLASNIKVASEDSGARMFKELYSKDRDFYNFVTDRMVSLYPENKYVFKGYRESMKVIDKMKKNEGYIPTSKELTKVYRLFNYVIPNDGSGDARVAKDVATQRAKFFTLAKENGYGALLDVNDAIYGGFKAKSPVIVFDMESIIPKDVMETTYRSKVVSEVITAMNKAGLIPGN